MIKLKASLHSLKLDLRKYRAELERRAADNISRSAFEWVNTAIDIIPSWSGASRATLMSLAEEIGVPVPIEIQPGAPNRVSLGKSKSESDINLAADDGRFTFSYSTDLDHLVYNEFNNANVSPDPGLYSRLRTPGPYGFSDAAKTVAIDVLSQFRPPDLATFVTPRTVRR